MEELIIRIDWIYFLGIIGSLIAIAWYSSGRFAKSETLLSTIDKRLTNVEGRFSGAFQSQSPISLTVRGNKLLEDSGLKKYIDDNKNDLSLNCKVKKNLNNAYDVQETSFNLLDSLVFDTNFDLKIKEYAFQQGIDIAVLKRVGGIYLRNLLLEELGMKEKDLDIPITEQKNDITN